MTIRELIEELKKHPEDQQAFYYDVEDGFCTVNKVGVRDQDNTYPAGDFNPAGKIVLLS